MKQILSYRCFTFTCIPFTVTYKDTDYSLLGQIPGVDFYIDVFAKELTKVNDDGKTNT